MTSLLEKIVAIIAPHRCIVCSNEDNVLCDACLQSEHTPLAPTCVMCARPSHDWELCVVCARASGLRYVWAGGEYVGLLEKLVQNLKFQRVQAAHEPLGKIMLQVLPYDDWRVVWIPTAPQRIRMRGYDQAQLLAQYIAKNRGLPLSPALARVEDTRQVGASRATRITQSKKVVHVVNNDEIRGKRFLLVDDVCTTGATLSAAAHTLRQAGAAEVDAIVAAWQPPKKFQHQEK